MIVSTRAVRETAILFTIEAPACQFAFLITPDDLASTVIHPNSAIFVAVPDPTLDLRARPKSVTGVNFSIESRREAFGRTYVPRAEGSNTDPLGYGKRNVNVFINPRQRFGLFGFVDDIALRPRQLHAFDYRLAIYKRHAAADCPNAAPILISNQLVPSLSLWN